MPEVFTELIPITASAVERAAMEHDLCEFVANLRETGLDPVVDVETTSGGDVFIVTMDGEPL